MQTSLLAELIKIGNLINLINFSAARKLVCKIFTWFNLFGLDLKEFVSNVNY